MNRWNLGWRASARLRYGLHWRKAAPTLADFSNLVRWTIYEVVAFAFIALAWCWAMDRDYAEEQRQVAEQAERVLLECMNGQARWITPDGKQFVACDKAWSYKL